MKSENNNRFFIEQTEHEEESQYKEEETERQSSLVCLFEEDLILAYTADTARTTFFSAIQDMERKMNKGGKHLGVLCVTEIKMCYLFIFSCIEDN